MPTLDDAIQLMRTSFAEQREELTELYERFDALRKSYRELEGEITITLEEEEALLEFLEELELPGVTVGEKDRDLLLSMFDKLKERKHAREEGDRTDNR